MIVKCNECKHPISSKADRCPHCGAPVENKWFWIFDLNKINPNHSGLFLSIMNWAAFICILLSICGVIFGIIFGIAYEINHEPSSYPY